MIEEKTRVGMKVIKEEGSSRRLGLDFRAGVGNEDWIYLRGRHYHR